MTDATADGEEEGGAEKAGKGKTIKLAGIGGVVVVVLLAAGYFFLGGGSAGPEMAEGANGADGTAGAAVAAPAPDPVFHELPEMTVNLSSPDTEPRFLRLKVSLELPDSSMIGKIEKLMPRVSDTFQTYLRELRAEDLTGSAGMFRLKDELRKRVNAAIAPAQVNAVLFGQILVQ